ncbi:ATPase [Nonomuraea wenchangensis]|uniref:RapZ C-terminal domain-containing protein n=1 Tax=Nonomuraea wenchangensis TaxID=568860 RepID=UPI0037240614
MTANTTLPEWLTELLAQRATEAAGTPASQQPTAVEITSFGYGHAAAPQADIVVDARRRFRNPHADPAMRELTGLQESVRAHVLATPGVAAVVRRTAQLAAELTTTTGAAGGPVSVAVGCVGGRHRSVAMAEAIAAELAGAGLPVALVHRDVARPVIQR